MTESSSADRTEHCPESSTVGGPEHCRERAAEDDPRLPRVLVNSSQLPAEPARGAVWSITGAERDLDSNLIRLPPGERIDLHVGAEVDVLIHVVSGAGALLLPEGEHPLRAGTWRCFPGAPGGASAPGQTDWSTSRCTVAGSPCRSAPAAEHGARWLACDGGAGCGGRSAGC